MAVYNQDGILVRELLRGMRPGSNAVVEVAWDGLDGEGNPVPPGEYEWRMVVNPGFTARYVTSLGSWHTDQPWLNWVGDHAGPGSIAVDDSGIYIGSVEGEGKYMMLKLDPTGEKRLWDKHQYYQHNGNCLQLAATGKHLFHLQSRPWPPRKGRKHQNVYLRRLTPEGRHQKRWDIIWDHVTASGMDAHGETLVVSYSKTNGLRWISQKDGSTLHERTDIPGAAAMALGGDETAPSVLVANSNALFRIADQTAKPELLLKLDGIVDVDIEHQSGQVVIARETETVAELRLYDQDLNLIKIYGGQKRPYGPYDDQLFRRLTAVAFDQSGNLITTERSFPRRTLKVDIASGEVDTLAYGNRPFYTFAAPDPRHPERHWVNNYGRIVVIDVDYDTGRWKPLAVMDYRGLADGRMEKSGKGWSTWEPFFVKDKLLLRASARPALMMVNTNNWTLKPVAWIGDEKLPRSSGTYMQNMAYLNGGTVFPIRKQEHPPRITWDVTRAEENFPAPEHLKVWQYRDMLQTEEGNVFAVVNGTLHLHDQLVKTWPLGGFRKTRLLSWTKDGKLRFSVGRKHNYPHETNTGRLAFPTFIKNGPYGTIMVNDQIYNQGPIYTQDGLFVGNVMMQRAEDGLPNKAYSFPGDDYQNAYMVEHHDGRIFYISPDVGMQRVYEITGWDQIRRFHGNLSRPKSVREAKHEGTGLSIKAIDNGNEQTGFIEAPFSETYTLEFRPPKRSTLTCWIDGKQVYPTDNRRQKRVDVTLQAGRQTPIRIVFEPHTPKDKFTLLWQSLNLDLERIPETALYQ